MAVGLRRSAKPSYITPRNLRNQALLNSLALRWEAALR
jgi:hypothetical protein